ncbi:MAG: dihydrolipoyl dehydrogenase [Deltaproteobacteria bacterium]|nr:dihydrolipoyl dehydrogenase [Deltaproteobacteria bacterium]MBW2200670.1 dihydrolipoyl dehydrogenase [Deltaproteobacteria bacterium]MBW2539325.1 dihydrolipoyl dehydrogenase [Deltaproteobacteria bacterium]
MAVKIVVVGAGPGGYVAAIRAAQMGAEVTIVEGDRVGGTCLNRGCIPSKIMKTTAEMMDHFHRASEFAIETNGKFLIDMQALMARKEKVIQSQAKGILGLFKHHKIHYLQGCGTIAGPHKMIVKQQEGNAIQVSWDRLILAMGSQPSSIPAFPFDGQRIISSNDALDLQVIPKSMLIIGGGVIGCEFAFIFSSLGSKVTVVEALSRVLPLPSVDEDCSKILQREMKKRNIQVMVNRGVAKFDDKEAGVRVSIGPSPFLSEKDQAGIKSSTIEVDGVLVCIGRQPNTANSGIEKLGVKTDDKGWIIANEMMETGVPGVYAIGDVLGPSKIMLAHVASTEGWVAAQNAMGARRIMNYDIVPGAIYTMPEVANVGLTEAQAKSQGYNMRSDSALFRNLGKAHVIGEISGQAKIVSDTASGKILGVHIIGPHATDLIAEATLAMQMGCTVKDLSETIHAHPTLTEIMAETSFKAIDSALHG